MKFNWRLSHPVDHSEVGGAKAECDTISYLKAIDQQNPRSNGQNPLMIILCRKMGNTAETSACMVYCHMPIFYVLCIFVSAALYWKLTLKIISQHPRWNTEAMTHSQNWMHITPLATRFSAKAAFVISQWNLPNGLFVKDGTRFFLEGFSPLVSKLICQSPTLLHRAVVFKECFSIHSIS